MLTGELVITVPGTPATKGSLKCVAPHARGQRAQLVEELKASKPWRDKLAGWLTLKYPAGQRADKRQPLGAELTFTLDRPKAHYGTGRNATTLKPSAPAYPTGHDTGDADKLLRLALDAMQDAELMPDDCQIVEVTSRKVYPLADDTRAGDALPWPGVVIRVYPMP
jgi:Holliday junction resolvase RusA-like endonuclease